MNPEIIEDKTFSKIEAETITANRPAYENCKFTGCDLSYADLSGILFADCRFEACNLSLTGLTDTGWQNVFFKDCKLTGANFSKSSDFLFQINLEDCILDNAIFFKKKNKGAKFTGCSIVEADFTEADLTDVQFINCNLNRAFSNRTILKNADLRTSYNYTIDPDINVLKKAKFSVHGLAGLLAKYDIRIEG